jgi:hypothetical protein
MKLKLLSIAVPALALLAYAQEPSQNPSQSTTQEQKTQEQKETTTSSQSTQSTDMSKSMGSKNLRGMLVNADCTPSGSTSTSSSTNPSAADRSSTSSQENTSANRSTTSSTETGSTTDQSTSSTRHSEKKSTRTGSMSEWQSCAATANTTSFGLVLNDGRMLRFDPAGNTKAQDEVKNNPKLTASANKPAKVRVRGTVAGDTLQVESIK